MKVNGKAIAFGREETDFLEIWMRQTGKVAPREAIETALYGLDEAVTPIALEALVSRIRRRLANAGAENILYTVRSVGYFLKGDPS